MTEPTYHQVILPPIEPGHLDDPKELYKHFYELWKRTGGYTSQIPDLKGLKVSVKQLNTLLGIRTDDTVQEQLNSKVNADDLGSMAYQDDFAVDINGGTVENVAVSASSVTNSDVSVNFGGSGVSVPVGGTAHVDTTLQGSVGATETDLMTYTLPTDSLSVNNQYIEISGWGKVAANGNNKRIRLYFGSTVLLDTTSVAANNASWYVKAIVVRTSATTQQAIATITSDSNLILEAASSTTPGETMENQIVLKFTGTGVANDDIDQRGLIIKWFKS